MFKKTIKILLAASAIGALGCGAPEEDVSSTEGAVLGDALAGTNATTFAAAKANFAAAENARRRSRTDLQRAELRCLPRQRRGRRRRTEHRAPLRHADQRRVRSDGRAPEDRCASCTASADSTSVGLNCQSGTDANPAPGATIFAAA